MYIGFYSYYKNYNNNKLFSKKNDTFTPSSLVPAFGFLKERLQKQGHKVSTVDLDNMSNFDAIVFLEFPGFKNKYFKKVCKRLPEKPVFALFSKFLAKKFPRIYQLAHSANLKILSNFRSRIWKISSKEASQAVSNSKKLYLVAYESPVIKPDNLDAKTLKYFKKVFTWSDDLIDNKKYFKINYSYQIPEDIYFDLDKKEKLCVIISSNKSAKHPKELYSERIKAIRWFEQNHPQNFDLYGLGWDRHNFQGSFLGIKLARLNRLKFLTKLLGPHYPSYRGMVKSKEEIYGKYKFSICYENVEGFNGYITEKIFDCFLSGCVPVYLGAPNISQHIPHSAFIDKRNFKNYEELYAYLKNMPDAEYQNYLIAIKQFLQSDAFYPFTIDYLVKLISDEISN